jgi:hypothetical protein
MGQAQSVLPAALVVAGMLCLPAQSQWAGAMRVKEPFTYGRFESRFKSADPKGTVMGFFLYYLGDDRLLEIDVELLGIRDNEFQSNLWGGTKQKDERDQVWYKITNASNIHADYHTFAFEWTPDYVAWFYDGKEVRRETAQNPLLAGYKDMKLHLFYNFWPWNVAWTGWIDMAALPYYVYISYLDYYAYTPGKGPNGSDFTLQWRDNFDSLDLNRWAYWVEHDSTAPGIGHFVASNVVAKGGKAILCVTREGEAPQVDQMPVPEDPKDEHRVGSIRKAFSGRQAQTPRCVLFGFRDGFVDLSIPSMSHAYLEILSYRGRHLGSIDLGKRESGPHSIDARGMLARANGCYIARLIMPDGESSVSHGLGLDP